MTNKSFNMQFKINVILFVTCSAVLGIALCSPIEQITIFDMMKRDNQSCDPVISFLNNTKYVPIRCNITYSSKLVKSDEDTNDQLLCYGIYDAMCKVCQQGSLGIDVISKFYPQSKKIDDALNDDKKELRTKIDPFCKNIVKRLINPHKNIESHVNLLKQKFSDLIICVHICSYQNSSLNPLCIILDIMYNIIEVSYSDGKSPGIAELNNPPIQNSNSSIQNEQKIIKEDKSQNLKKSDNKNKKENLKDITPKVTEIHKSVPKSNKTEIETNTKNSKVDKPPKLNDEENPKINKSKPENKTQHENIINNQLGPPDNIGVNVDPKNIDQTINEESIQKEEPKEIEVTQGTSQINREPDHQPPVVVTSTEKLDNPMNPSVEDTDNKKNDLDNEDLNNEMDKSDQNQLEHSYQTEEAGANSSHIFLYFTMMSLGCIMFYILYLSKQKILSIFGKLRRRNRNRRRPSTANYRKLDCTLEEAVTSQCNANVTHVIY